MSVERFYCSSQRTDHDEVLTGKPAFPLSELRDSVPDRDCESTVDVLRYLSSVSQQSRSAPVVVVADIHQKKDTVLSDQGTFAVRSRPDYKAMLEDDVVLSLKYGLFQMLRAQVRRDDVSTVLVSFTSDSPDESSLEWADEASVVSAVERLSRLTRTLPGDSVLRWLFALMVYLKTPLLDDTASALQVLRKFCEQVFAETTNDVALILAIVISIDFSQP